MVHNLAINLDGARAALALLAEVLDRLPGLRRDLRFAEGRCKATWKREFKLPWREAGSPNHHDDTVDSDQ